VATLTPPGGSAPAGAGRAAPSAPPVRRTLAAYAGLAAEIAAAIAIGCLITVLFLMLDPSLMGGDPPVH